MFLCRSYRYFRFSISDCRFEMHSLKQDCKSAIGNRQLAIGGWPTDPGCSLSLRSNFVRLGVKHFIDFRRRVHGCCWPFQNRFHLRVTLCRRPAVFSLRPIWHRVLCEPGRVDHPGNFGLRIAEFGFALLKPVTFQSEIRNPQSAIFTKILLTFDVIPGVRAPISISRFRR